MFSKNNTSKSQTNYNFGITPEILFKAFDIFRSNNTDKLQLLLEKAFVQGININVQDKDGRTLLHYAIDKEFWDVAQFLLEKGISPNISDKNSWIPLHEIIMDNFFEQDQTNMAELLIQKGSNIELKDLSTCTPIQLAAVHGHIEAVKLLIQYGANINVIVSQDNPFYRGKSLIELAPEYRHKLKALLKLTIACKNNDFGIIDNSVTTKDIEEFVNWQISITPKNSRFFSKHLSELYNLQNYLINNPKFIDGESIKKLNDNIDFYTTLKKSLILKIVEDLKFQAKICDENFKPYTTIPDDLITCMKNYGLNLTGEVTEATPETT